MFLIWKVITLSIYCPLCYSSLFYLDDTTQIKISSKLVFPGLLWACILLPYPIRVSVPVLSIHPLCPVGIYAEYSVTQPDGLPDP